MKFNANKNEYLYLQIGTGRFWKQCWSLTDIERVSISEQIEYVLFNANGWNAEIIYLLYLDHRDLEGFDCSYNKGTHSSKHLFII